MQVKKKMTESNNCTPMQLCPFLIYVTGLSYAKFQVL